MAFRFAGYPAKSISGTSLLKILLFFNDFMRSELCCDDQKVVPDPGDDAKVFKFCKQKHGTLYRY